MAKDRIVTEAVIIRKTCIDHISPSKNIPSPQSSYELVFVTPVEVLSFKVTLFEYSAVECKDWGILVYEGDHLISFGENIKEYQMN